MPTHVRRHLRSEAVALVTAARLHPSALAARRARPALFSLLTALALLASLLVRPAPALAAASPCDGEPEHPAAHPVAPASASAGLSDPFAYNPDAIDRQAVLGEVVQVVSEQAADLGVDACYREKPALIATRVDFLSPFEFVTVSLFDQDPARRDALLDQYASDPHGAIKALGDAYPSTRAQAVMATYAYYDLESGRLRVNAAKVPPADVRRVLVHEFWHAMPLARTWTAADGRTLRASGFWLQERSASRRTWVPLEDQHGLPYASYLLDEAMATTMENRYAGPSKFPRPELEEVQGFLGRLMGVAGTSAVMGDYLHSQPYDIGALAEAHRASFPELEPSAGP